MGIPAGEEFDFTADEPPVPDDPPSPPKRPRQRTEEPNPLLERLDRIALNTSYGLVNRIIAGVSWFVCLGFLIAAWGRLDTASRRGFNGVGVGDISYSILLAITGYIIARTVIGLGRVL